MKKYTYLLLLSVLYCNATFAQEYVPYTWSENPQMTILSDEEAQFPLYYLIKRESFQYQYDPITSDLVCYKTYHYKIKVTNDEALQSSNKIYIPLYNTLEVAAIQARTINQDNKVINFDQNNIKELEDDESGYKILAIEGAEVGGEIEYFYTLKTGSSNFMTRIIQTQYPVKEYGFSLTCPENLEYDFKLYNSAQQVIQTDTTDQYNAYALQLKNIPALYEEAFSAYENSKIQMGIKLAYNSNSKGERLNTWSDAGKVIFSQVYNLESSDKKAVAKFVKGIKATGTALEQFRTIEHHIKTSFFLEENAGEAGTKISAILSNKYATSLGFTKLFAEILTQLNLTHEIVLSSDRMDRAFDPDFDSWNFLEEYMIYLSDSQLFTSPKDMQFRTGTIPEEFIGNYGLFVRPELIQNYIYPITHIEYIPIPSYQENFDNMDLVVEFNSDLTSNTVQLVRDFKGFSASYYKSAWLFLEEKDRKEMIEDAVKYLASDAEIAEITAPNVNATYQKWQDVFTVSGTFNTKLYIESAGDIILFKAGELIGPQSELYQEQTRMTQIVNSYNRGYDRKIKVTLPKGYTIKNPEELVINEKVLDGKKEIYVFESSYEIKGDVLEIRIIEFYDELYYPVEKFEAFRKVINSAADWNKIVLVLSPQG